MPCGQPVCYVGSRLRPQSLGSLLLLIFAIGASICPWYSGWSRGSPLGMASVWATGTRECIGDGWREPETVLQEERQRGQIGTVSTITTKKAEAAHPCVHTGGRLS